MESIADKIKKAIILEGNKNLNNKMFSEEFNQLLAQMEKLGYSQKPKYTFPLVDTIGKTTYSVLNKHAN